MAAAPDAIALAILDALMHADGQHMSLPRLGKRLGLGASAVMRRLSSMGDAELAGVRGPGWVRVEHLGDRWVVHLTDDGRAFVLQSAA